MDRSQRMGEGSIPRLLYKFSMPAIVGMLAQALYNVVDRVFIGRAVGPEGIAGATVSFPFMLILMAFGMLVGIGATALVSIRLGEHDKDDAERVLGNATVLLVVQSVVLTLAGLLMMDWLLGKFGASEQILPYAHRYLQIILVGSVFQSIGFGLNAVIRGEGNPRMAMLTMLLGAFLNIILDPIFLFGFGWGMQGAAAATVLAQAVSALWVLGYFLGSRSLLNLRVRNLRLQWCVCWSIVAVGSPFFAMHIAASVLNAILNNQLLEYGGDLAISVMGIVYAVAMFILMPIFGITQGAQPIIGYNYGALKFDRVKWALELAILAATTISCAGFVLVMVFPADVIRLFNSEDKALLELGVHALRMSLMMMPVVGFQVISANYFQATGKPKQAMFLSLSRQVLLLIPALLILPSFFGLDGVWAAIPASDLGSSVLTAIWLVWELRHLDERHARRVAQEPVEAVLE